MMAFSEGFASLKNSLSERKREMSFRDPRFVKRYEWTYADLETPLNNNVSNSQAQRKDNYRFVVDNFK